MNRSPRFIGFKSSLKRQKGRTNYNVRSSQCWIQRQRQWLGVGGVVAEEAGELTASQIFALEFVIKKELKGSSFVPSSSVSSSVSPSSDGLSLDNLPKKRLGSYILRVFPHRSRSKKPNETGLGRGKGSISSWVTRVRKGQILVEFDSPDRDFATRVGLSVAKKLPIKSSLIFR